MITLEQLRTGDPRDMTVGLSYMAEALIRTARHALENDGTADDARACAANTLEVAELLMELLMDGCEGLERSARRGPWASHLTAA
ncbi:hypothetical protein LAZ29_12215 [Cereibacter sphaeroides]|uniref:hypothetical protein n=1 Tax=Cereibacter sphaeroides TaxID=1063 RepID=UPI001F237DF9|nr:hypothetical protein [Cereibacter sphaeroides]MCE6951692.1 hypothetical protein [Cereibacter sphaeroides]